MRKFSSILLLVCSVWPMAGGMTQSASAQGPAQAPAEAKTSAPTEDKSTRKAKEIVAQGIQALGGDAYLNIRDREQRGRGSTLHHGQQTGTTVLFWMFSEFPDKERIELTEQRDVSYLYVGNKGYEITYRGPHPVEDKDLVDYMRQKHYSLDTVLRTWVKDPAVLFLYEGNALAAQHEAYQITLINSKDESVTLYFDVNTHLPIKKTFTWRDPVDKQKNLEEEIYDNYRFVTGGVMAPFNVTRYFNGDMSRQRFFFEVTINQGLDQAMFDPNSGYNPNKPVKKK
jgi:hypothetical protein